MHNTCWRANTTYMIYVAGAVAYIYIEIDVSVFTTYIEYKL